MLAWKKTTSCNEFKFVTAQMFVESSLCSTIVCSHTFYDVFTVINSALLSIYLSQGSFAAKLYPFHKGCL